MLGQQVRRRLDLFGRRLPHQVGVDLARHGGARMTEDHLNDFDRDPACEQK